MIARWLVVVVGLAVLPGTPATSAEAPVTVQAVWARATPGAATNGAIYLTIVNNAPTVDRLLAISTPIAQRVEMHASVKDRDVVAMRPVAAVLIEPRQTVEFKPGGLHVMLIDLKQPLRQGDHFPITAIFDKAGPVAADGVVLSAGAKSYP